MDTEIIKLDDFEKVDKVIIKIQKWNKCKEAAFSSSWDDATITSLYNITDEANKRNIKTTIYINGENKEWHTDLFLGNNFKTSTDYVFNDEIKHRIKYIHSKGNEIGNHTYSHVSLPGVSTEIAINQIKRCNELIKSITNQTEFSFCYPNGHKSVNKKVKVYLQRNFISCRGSYYNILEDIDKYMHRNIDFLDLKGVHIGPYPNKKSEKELNTLVDKTIKKNGWLIEYGHGWENDAWKPINKDVLLKHYNYIQKKDLWCSTVLDISKYIIQRDSIKLNLVKTRYGYILSFSNIKNNSPLTLSYKCNKIISIWQDNKYIPINNHNNINYFILYDYTSCMIKLMCDRNIRVVKDNDYSCWENCETTRDEKEIIDYLKQNMDLIKNKKILHVGIGNSDLGINFQKETKCIDGITISNLEVKKALDFNCYRNIYLCNKYNTDDMQEVTRNYDIIIDQGIKQYACCNAHFDNLFNFYINHLTNNGILIISRYGMNWSGYDLKTDLETKKTNRISFKTNTNKKNIFSNEELNDLQKRYKFKIDKVNNTIIIQT